MISTPAYPIAFLHVAMHFLLDVQRSLNETISAAENQTRKWTIPVHDIFLPTEGDFERLRVLMESHAWLFPEAFLWPQILRDEMEALPLFQVPALKADLDREGEAFIAKMEEYAATQLLVTDWIRRVKAEAAKPERRNLRM